MNDTDQKDNISRKDVNDFGYKTLFSNDRYLMYVHKKSHSISRAVYLITDFFEDSEPIKTRLRQLASDLIDQVLSLSIELSPGRKLLLDGIIKSCLSIISHSEIAMFSGIESRMNHSILRSEIENLISTIEEREVPSRLGRHFVLDDSMILKDNCTEPSPLSPISQNYSAEGARNRSPQSINRTTRSSDLNSQRQPLSTNAEEKKNNRRQAILSIIKVKGQSSIKDITDVVNDCSEKTIQRELLDLVEANILKKEGERRWTRYSLYV